MPLFGKLSKKQHSDGVPGSDTGNGPRERREIRSGSISGKFFNNRWSLPMSTNGDSVLPSISTDGDIRVNGIHSAYGELSLNDSSPRTSFRSPTPPPPPDSVKTIKGGNPMSCQPAVVQETKLAFHCQFAHGSPTGLLQGFTDLTELYELAAECYEIPTDDILFCTVNTRKVDMEHLLGGQIRLNDFIFLHLNGQKKEVEVVKDEPLLGVTVTDNGAGKVFIKRIKPNSVIGRLADIIQPGDHIEKINGESMLMRKHFEVAKYLIDLPVGSTFTLRLIEPRKAKAAASPSMSSSFISVPHRDDNGTKTLRFKARKGTKAAMVTDTAPGNVVIERINAILESYLGIHDSELALTIWDMAKEPPGSNNPVSFMSSVKRSELADFRLPDEVIFDLWAATKEQLFHIVTARSAKASNVSTADDRDRTLTHSLVSTKSVIK